MYNVELEINNQTYKASAPTLPSAIRKLKRPDIIKTLGVLTVVKGDKRTSRTLNIPRIKSLFGNKIYRVIISKNLEHFLK